MSSIRLLVTEKNRFEYSDGPVICVTLVQKSKDKLDFYLVIVSLGKTFQVRIMTLASTVLKNQHFKYFSFECIRKQI